MKNKELKKKVLESCEKNHIWINAFAIINPTDETCKNIGRAVINLLKQDENKLPSYWTDDDESDVSDIQKMCKTTYLNINAS